MKLHIEEDKSELEIKGRQSPLTFNATLSVQELESLLCEDCGHSLFQSSFSNAYDELHLHCVPALQDSSLPEGKRNGCGAVYMFRINFDEAMKEKDFTYIRRW